METGTELRSALMKLKQQQLFEAEDVVEHMREKNINTIYRWMEDGNNEDASDISHDDRRFTNINQQRNAPRENYQQSASPGQRPYRNAWDDNYDRHARQVPLAEVDVSDYQEVNRPALRVRSKSPTKRLPNENIG